LAGFSSCGCFGNVHVNPWKTFSFIDLPAVVLLAIFRPYKAVYAIKLVVLRMLRFFSGANRTHYNKLHKPRLCSVFRSCRRLFFPLAFKYCLTIAALVFVLISVSTVVLIANEPKKVTSRYEVLEPKDWINQQLPVLKHIDIAGKLTSGNWLVLFYHYNCPGCARAIPQYEQMMRDLAGNEDFLNIAFIEIPPYGDGPVSKDSPCVQGKLADTKEWFVTTPAVVLLKDGVVLAGWQAKAPDFDTVIEKMDGSG
jgi:thiol-disulfide isomerase/thioredoxin